MGPYVVTDASPRAGYGAAASYTTSSLAVGTHSITSSFAGNGVNSTSVSPVLSQIVNKTTPPFFVSCSPSTVTYGQSYICSANVSGDCGGTISLTVNGSAWASGSPNSSGIFTASGVASGGIGAYTIGASYSGDSNYTSATASTTLTVTKAVLTVTANNASMTYDGAVPGFTPSYSGFENGDTASVLSGAASLTTVATSTSQVGSYPIVAAAGTLSAGNYSFAFLNGTLTITKATPTVGLASSLNPSTYTTPVTFTATVPAGATGTITFYDSAAPLGTATIIGTSAMLATNALNAGSHSITAQYSGDSNDSDSTSAALSEVVNQAQVVGSGASTLNPSAYGDNVTLTFDFSGAGAVPTGTATITQDGNVVATVALDGTGKATYSPSVLAAGSHSITATYNGNLNYF
jgi:hypothetical protein